MFSPHAFDNVPAPGQPPAPMPEPDAHSVLITDRPALGEYGAHAFGRDLAVLVARILHTPVTGLVHRENPWYRRACPHAQFWDLTAAGHEIRVTGYETPSPRSSGTYSAYAIHLDGQPVPFRRAPLDRLEIQLAYAIWSAHFDLPEHAHHTTTDAEIGSDSEDPVRAEPPVTPLRVWTCAPCGYISIAPRVDRDALHLRADNTHPPSWHTPTPPETPMPDITPGPGPVRSLFTIDPQGSEDVFDGWHHPSQTWNGWATPAFDTANALKVIAWTLTHPDTDDGIVTTFTWDGDVLLIIETDTDNGDTTTERVEPDADGRYPIGAFSWTWCEITVPDGEELGPWLARRADEITVSFRTTSLLRQRSAVAAQPPPTHGALIRMAGERAVLELDHLRPREPHAPLPAATVDHLIAAGHPELTDEGAWPTWENLTDTQRALILNLAITRATPPDLLTPPNSPDPRGGRSKATTSPNSSPPSPPRTASPASASPASASTPTKESSSRSTTDPGPNPLEPSTPDTGQPVSTGDLS